MMVIVADVLHQMIQTPKSIQASMALTIFARMFWLFRIEFLEVAVQDIQSGEGRTTFACIWLVLKLLRMAK